MNKIYDDITIVTVLYNSKKSAQSFFSSLENFSIIVVDNGRNEKVLEKIKGYKNIKIISKNKNTGYGSAINFAVKKINIGLICFPFLLTIKCIIRLIKGTFENIDKANFSSKISISR